MDKEYSAARNFVVTGAFWVIIGGLVGLVAATEMVSPDFLGGIPFFVFGRLRPLHVNVMFFLWVSSIYFGAFLYIVPKLCGTKLYSEKLGNVAMVLWNFVGIFALFTLLTGYTQGREYAELIWPIDILVEVVLLMNLYNIVRTILARKEKKLFVSLWYITGAMLWLPIVYAIGNVIWDPFTSWISTGTFNGNLLLGFPGGSLDGIRDSIWNWYYGHNVLGLWFTPGGVAMVYYFLPVIIRSPLYSHTLSLIGFWGLAFFYTMVGHHHILQTPTPGYLKTIATLGSIGLFVPVFTFLGNIWMTMRGSWGKIYESIPLKFLIVGTVWYFVTCVQGPFQAIQGFNRLIHFTNWIVGHAHLAMLGTMSSWAMGAVLYMVPVISRKRLWSPALAEAQFWLVTMGFILMMITLQVGGLVQGGMWMAGQTVYAGVPQMRPYYIGRAISGILLFAGFSLQFYNIYKTIRSSEPIRASSAISAADVPA